MDKCPKCNKMDIQQGKLMGWNEETRKADIVIFAVEEGRKLSLNTFRCQNCGYMAISTD